MLIASYLEPEHVARIEEVDGISVRYRPDLIPRPRYLCDHVGGPLQRTPAEEQVWRSLLATSQVLFDFDYTNLPSLRALIPSTRWIQASSAGIGQLLLRTGLIDSEITFTTAAGLHGRALAEFVLMAMLFFVKDGPRMRRLQAERRWERYCGRILSGTACVVGFGSVGREVARLSRGVGLRVVAVNRTGPQDGSLDDADLLLPVSRLNEALPEADYVVLACPHTPETEGLIGRRELDAMKRDVILINIARGAVVDEAALLEALSEGRLGGAALDVFAREPLPPDSPFWNMPNVLISPHSASTVEDENARLTDLFCDNVRRYLTGRPLRNVFDRARLY